MDATDGTRLGRWLLPLLKLRIRLAEFAHHNETQTTLFWAGIVGFVGGVSSVAFRKLTDGLSWLFTIGTADMSRRSRRYPSGSESSSRQQAGCSQG